MTTTRTVRGHADTALPPVVSAEDWRQARDQLLIAEKETRALVTQLRRSVDGCR